MIISVIPIIDEKRVLVEGKLSNSFYYAFIMQPFIFNKSITSGAKKTVSGIFGIFRPIDVDSCDWSHISENGFQNDASVSKYYSLTMSQGP